MKLKKLKDWWKQKVKKSKKDNIKTILSGSDPSKIDVDMLDEKRTDNLIESLMDRIMSSEFFHDTFEKLANQEITMLVPYEGRDTFYLFSPITQSFRMITAPTEAIVLEESRGDETLCLIHDVPYSVPNKYLKNVGYN
jgi:hypothetical protein